MGGYFIADIRMLEFQTAIANYLRSAGKLASASRPSRGRLSLNTTVQEAPKKCKTAIVLNPPDNTSFDKLDDFPVFQ